jgi:hypothetical protein
VVTSSATAHDVSRDVVTEVLTAQEVETVLCTVVATRHVVPLTARIRPRTAQEVLRAVTTRS